MFQFRAFPSYGYLIHRTILEYCSSVLPHSDISGSSLICSSPKLFAACRVLHRLLMPRHSPCALIRLTFVAASFASIRFRLSTKAQSLRCGSSQIQSLRFEFGIIDSLYNIGSLELCRFNRSLFTKLYLPLFLIKSSTMLFFSAIFIAPLCCLAFVNHISSVQFSRCNPVSTGGGE